jgi:predicted AAA+ superfamily ATPase
MRDLIRQKIVDALALPVPGFTRRTVRLLGVPGKVVAVIGPRRAGKTTFLWQVLADRLESGTPREGLLYFSVEDERLAEMAVAELQWVVEEYYALCPEWRDRFVPLCPAC